METKYHKDPTVTENRPRERWTLQQIGAVVSIFIISAWSIVVFLIHAYTPLSGDTLELAFIGTVAVVSLLLLPFYLKRVKWSYLGGILVTILLVIGAIMIALNRAIFFSPSVYNIFVIVVYIAAFACLSLVFYLSANSNPALGVEPLSVFAELFWYSP